MMRTPVDRLQYLPVTLLSVAGRNEDEAYAILRQLAMSHRETIEDAAYRLVRDARNEGGLHGQVNKS